MKSLPFLTALFALVIGSVGCALTTDRIDVNYTAQTYAARIPGAEKVKVKVTVSDARAVRDKVSAKKNGYGMEMAPIVAGNDVADTLAKALETELASRGFTTASGPVEVNVELDKFWNDFKIGFWAGSSTAELVMNAQVKKPDGTIVYTKVVTGEGAVPSLQVMTGDNAKIALDAALNDAVAKLVGDTAFIRALLGAAA